MDKASITITGICRSSSEAPTYTTIQASIVIVEGAPGCTNKDEVTTQVQRANKLSRKPSLDWGGG